MTNSFATNSFAVVYPQLADRLAAEVPELAWIDLDQDQLDNEAEEYALPYDGGVLLISFDEVQWQDLGQGYQRGDALIRFTLALQVVEDSYQHAAQRPAALAKLQRLGQIHAALQHFAGAGFGALVREYSRKEPGQRGLWIFSQGYRCRLSDETGYQGGAREAVNLDTTPTGQVIAPAAAEKIFLF